ncbi:krox-like protein, putative [Plasmodium knowlesi strain H]|uniref:Oxidation resistance protein 1 n=3 Tax=Plasmodium knowlesi TaxID=5850 RepID=A0A5K1UK45_PLAKH|nr:TLD domain-containing protein, putative [Plasmodium knowlesi strain H]OTN66415.1 putative Krox-like protein [Plasmodium knowlesi]CAA9989898.1 TLD domain-containing protein, putative [Plasmodium knowlesi strain H]SBO24462.1 krox-like protein, putative [Plasmodium knowlesi strain H]SBO26528.1 krox-like protein, putative [Plasmodium knowlesi strain H]VVS79372.1 TLD domain-containing protein, putative [Plasmodium knowlesi strain H]|eukprot:XP_002259914.1 krox-like protein, putative [Plasmodium knowlesi strain H]
MGEAHSKNTLKYGCLSEEDVEKIRKKFNLNKKEINERVRTLDFIYVYPHILRPYIALVLPSLHEVLRRTNKKSENSMNNYGLNYALNILFNKNNKKVKNEISLQDIINILSYIRTIKTRVLVRILFRTFLKYTISKSNNRSVNSNSHSNKLKNMEENEEEDNENGMERVSLKEDDNKTEQIEDTPSCALKSGRAKQPSEGICTNEDVTQEEEEVDQDVEVDFHQDGTSYLGNSPPNEENDVDADRDDEDSPGEGDLVGRDRNSFEFVFSDSNVNIINKNKKKERNYKFINDNIFFLDKHKLKNQYPRNYMMKDLISVEEAMHHLFTYIYIEQLYILCSNSTLFKLSSRNPLQENKNNFLKHSTTSVYDDIGAMKRKNSWDMAYFFNELFYSLEANLDFRNIITGFRLFVNSIDNNKHSIYSLAIEYISSTFTVLSENYINATFKHFMDNENIFVGESSENKRDVANGENGTNDDKREDEFENLNDMCINSIELIHTIYTNMKKSEIKKKKEQNEQDEKRSKLNEDKYAKSSSIVEIQKATNDWRGLFLNKTSKILTDEIIFTLRQCSPCFMNNAWFRLYASWKQGTSFNRFISSLFYYESPIVIVIKTKDNQILGAVCTTPLKDSHLFQGSSNDFLFSAHPVFRIIRSNQFGTNYVYLNSKNSFYPKGLGFGGRTECFRLFLSDEFKESYCTQSDYTYKSGHLYFPHYQKEGCVGRSDNNKESSNKKATTPHGMNSRNVSNTRSAYDNDDDEDDDNADKFLYKLSINEVEAWGCGDVKALEQQAIMQQKEEASKQERSIDKSKIVQNSFDKEFLLPKVFVGGKYEELSPDK